MPKNSESFARYIVPIRDYPVFQAVRKALTSMIPLFMAGSIALFVNNLPIPSYQTMMAAVFGDGWRTFGELLYQGTFAVMSLGVLISVSTFYVSDDRRSGPQQINPLIPSLVALSCFFVLQYTPDNVLPLRWLGPLGLFAAVATALVSVRLFLFLYRIKGLHFLVYSDAAETTVTQALMSLAPALLTLFFFVLLRILLRALGIDDVNAALEDTLRQLFLRMPVTIFTSLLFVLVTHLFWFLGIHGNNILEPVVQNSFVPALEVNRKLVESGQAPTEIFTKQFFDVFVYMGGSGATLCLLIALLIFMRRSNARQIAMISVVPSAINVNEMLMYGLPLICNIYFLIPFVGVPLLLTLTTYAAMATGLVPLTVGAVEWTTPVFLGGYTATGSAAGIALQAFNLLVGVLAYMPFVRLHEKRLARDNSRTLDSLQKDVLAFNMRHAREFLNRRDSEGNLARILAGDIERDVRNGAMRLEYQPQVGNDGSVAAGECLLRWTHPQYGRISPAVVIKLAEETGFIHELGLWIIRSALASLKTFLQRGLDVTVSVNLTPVQLDWPELTERVKQLLDEAGIPPERIEIEITEQVALGGYERLTQIYRLQALGVRLAMDDFGMGHSSLMYLKEFNLDTIKLDGSLVKEVQSNQTCREIITSIVHLSRSMGISIVAEFVETAQQRDLLQQLGCDLYQGFLYSRSLTPDAFVEYCRALGQTGTE